jgi:hypothetical protein
MLLGALGMALLYFMSPGAVLGAALRAATKPVSLKLFVALSAIRAFEMLLRQRGLLQGMTEAAGGLLRSQRMVVVSMPLLIGMLPSVGGAYFSAPMVQEASRGGGLSAEDKGFINYWYRHPWEYVLPLYPGLVLAAALSGHELRGWIAANLSYALALLLGGFLFGLRRLKKAPHSPRRLQGRGLGNFWPLAAVLLLVMALGVELHWALLGVLAALLLGYRYKDLRALLRHALSGEVLVLIFGVMFFKEVMEASGAVEGLSAFLVGAGVPLVVVLAVLPLTGGLLTGLTIGFVGATFPLLMSLPGGESLQSLSFAFAWGFVGVLLSPVHVCLILTREYFKADLGGMYRRMLPAGALIALVAVVQRGLLHF